MADAHSATGDRMDCFSSPFGHTTLRCAGLEDWEARLLIFPVTLFLVGALVALGNWIRLGLNQKVFKRRHFVLLVFYGFLVFSLGIADKSRPAGSKPWHSSRIIGGLSILPDALFVAVVYHFLPPHVALPWWLDRMLAASSCSGLILMLIGGIREYSPDGLDDYDRDNVYAAASCEVVFLLGSLVASQCARYFAIMGEHGKYRTFINLDSASNSLFVIALLSITAQTCLQFVQPPDYTRVLAASMLGAVSYLLLIGVSIVQHLNMSDDPNENDKVNMSQSAKEVTFPEKMMEGGDIEILSNPNFQPMPPPRPSGEILNDNNSDFRLAQRYMQESEDEVRDAGSVKPGGLDSRGLTPTLDMTGPGTGDESVVWHGKYENRLRVHSGMSASSWGRLETIMRSRKQQQPLGRSGLNNSRPFSGMTYYGSETSFPDIVSHGTRRTSLTSSKAGWRSTLMSQIPPVPPIAPKFLRRAPSPARAAFAVPLTAGDTPIPLEVDEPKPTGDLSPVMQRSKTVMSSLTGLIWRRKASDGPYDDEKGLKRRDTMRDHAMASLPSLINRSKMSAGSDVKASTSTRTLQGSPHDHLKTSLPPQYQSSKLFPVPRSAQNEVVGGSGNHMTESPFGPSANAPWQDTTFASKSRWSGESDERNSVIIHVDRKRGIEEARQEARNALEASISSPTPTHESLREMSSTPQGVPSFDQQHAFASSFRNARAGSQRTIAEESEPNSDSMSRGVSGQSCHSDLSISLRSDETSPRAGKLQKETQHRAMIVPASDPASMTPDDLGATMRKRLSEPNLGGNRLTTTSTGSEVSTLSMEIGDIEDEAAYGGYRSSGVVGSFSSTRSGATIVPRQASITAPVAAPVVTPLEAPQRKSSAPVRRSSKRAASSARVAAERKGWTRTDADEDDARIMRDVSSIK